jgi:hypothetical protein
VLQRILIQQLRFGLDLVVNINIVRKCQQKRYILSPSEQKVFNLQTKANIALKLETFSLTKLFSLE